MPCCKVQGPGDRCNITEKDSWTWHPGFSRPWLAREMKKAIFMLCWREWQAWDNEEFSLRRGSVGSVASSMWIRLRDKPRFMLRPWGSSGRNVVAGHRLHFITTQHQAVILSQNCRISGNWSILAAFPYKVISEKSDVSLPFWKNPGLGIHRWLLEGGNWGL